MNNCLRFLFASLVFGASILARAEVVSTPHASIRPLGPFFAALDTDHNGVLSAKEIAAAPLTLTALDLNNDGLISPNERRATNADGKPVRVSRGATAFNVVFALDANHDGDIQSMEIANAVSSLKLLDRNGDGELTPNELRPAMVAQLRS